MNTYIWPANVVATERGLVVLSLPNWPDLNPSGETVQEAMLAASRQLSAAVEKRIEDNSDIPAPSDLGPRQVPIAIYGDTCAKVDAYIAKRQQERLRQQTELEQQRRDRRSAFLAEFRANLEPVERDQDRCNAGAVELALAGIRASYFLNAGGLVAIPAIMKIFPVEALPTSAFLWPAGVFAFGVLLTAACNFSAYFSLLRAGEGWSWEASARANEVIGNYYPPEESADWDAETAQRRVNKDQKLAKANNLAIVGQVSFVGAIASFLAGVGLSICAMM